MLQDNIFILTEWLGVMNSQSTLCHWLCAACHYSEVVSGIFWLH